MSRINRAFGNWMPSGMCRLETVSVGHSGWRAQRDRTRSAITGRFAVMRKNSRRRGSASGWRRSTLVKLQKAVRGLIFEKIASEWRVLQRMRSRWGR